MYYSHYDNAGRPFGLSAKRVQFIVRKYSLEKRRIYGRMAVNSDQFDQAMEKEGISMLPNYTRIRLKK